MQCFALQMVLQKAGHQVEIVHIELPVGILSWKGKLDYHIQNERNKRFRKKYYSKVTRVYHFAEQLRRNPPVADVYIVGSDQVWNPFITQKFGPEAFFLDFVPQGCRKVAYAASFGASAWTSLGTERDEEIRKLVSQFDAVSVRELDGVEICTRAFGRQDAVAVIDPVFLLEDYSSIIGSGNPTMQQVICYPLCFNEVTRDVFLQISGDMNLKPISFSRSIRGKGVKIRFFSSISKWLKTISRSQIVVTNSFHCMAFCILFHRKFIVTPPHPGRESRMLSMLSQLGIEDRYVESLSDFQKRKMQLYREIDYKAVDEKLNLLRRKSMDYLLNSLGR